MNIVDSSGWLAYFADEANAQYFLPPLSDTPSLKDTMFEDLERSIEHAKKVAVRNGGSRNQPNTAASWSRAQSTSSLVITKGGASRMVWVWVSLHNRPRSFRARQYWRAPPASG